MDRKLGYKQSCGKVKPQVWLLKFAEWRGKKCNISVSFCQDRDLFLHRRGQSVPVSLWRRRRLTHNVKFQLSNQEGFKMFWKSQDMSELWGALPEDQEAVGLWEKRMKSYKPWVYSSHEHVRLMNSSQAACSEYTVHPSGACCQESTKFMCPNLFQMLNNQRSVSTIFHLWQCKENPLPLGSGYRFTNVTSANLTKLIVVA